MGQDEEESGRGLVYLNVQVFGLGDWGRLVKLHSTIQSLGSGILIRQTRERGVENDVMLQVIKPGVGRQWRTALVWLFILVKCMEENVSNKHDINLCEARTSVKWLEVQGVSFFLPLVRAVLRGSPRE